MPYKNIYLFEGQRLGSSFSEQDDPYRALKEAHTKAVQVARILAHQVKGVTERDIEVQCWWYDPQYHFFPELFPPELVHASVNGKRGTLRTLRV